ncbi:MAG TPA: c-type cytochrome [Ignavibacteriaceae bacterium]|nr:c-type cytochrome [Ignavibacteriaceae bacterium]
MNFLDKLIIPLSPKHIMLLHYMLMLIFSLFIPFVSILLSGTFFSVYFKSRGAKENDHNKLRFSKDLMEVVTINKSMGIVLGVLTLLTSILIFMQLLSPGQSQAISYLIASFLLLIIGLVLVYTYFYSLKFSEVFEAIKSFKSDDKVIENEISELQSGSRNLSTTSGKFGFFFLFVSIWFFVAGSTLPVYPDSFSAGSILSVLFSWLVVSRFIQIIFISGAFTGATLLFAFFYWDGGRKFNSEEYKSMVRSFSIRLTFTSIIILPIFLLINLVTLPSDSLSAAVFFYSSAALVLIFLAYHYLYVMIRNQNIKYSLHIFVTVIVVIVAIVIKDQLALTNANEMQTVVMGAKYEEVMQKLTGANKAPKISGEDIYKNICSSCHSFDHKVVGPPYKQTLPKYKGNVDKLVAFILHPTQNNPGYPPMPNPGLNPAQAKAVATYILSEVKKYE